MLVYLRRCERYCSGFLTKNANEDSSLFGCGCSLVGIFFIIKIIITYFNTYIPESGAVELMLGWFVTLFLIIVPLSQLFLLLFYKGKFRPLLGIIILPVFSFIIFYPVEIDDPVIKDIYINTILMIIVITVPLAIIFLFYIIKYLSVFFLFLLNLGVNHAKTITIIWTLLMSTISLANYITNKTLAPPL